MKREDLHIRDPFIYTENGIYYLLGTTGNDSWDRGSDLGLYVSRSEIVGDCRIYSDAETYADGIRKILKRINDGYGRHGVFADLCDEKTVDDIIERIDEHGYNHRQSHFQNKRQNRLFFHECLIHGRILPKSDFYDIICFSFGRLRKCRRRITERNSAYPAQGFG